VQSARLEAVGAQITPPQQIDDAVAASGLLLEVGPVHQHESRLESNA
jgi:hypothetical protein